MSSHVYHGPWINWSKGLISGATVTLGQREGGFLTAFIATFVTVVGAELWKIICFVAHQARSRHKPQDGLYHQQQVILRTSPTPAGAAWLFLQQTWFWSGKARASLLRTLPWAIFGILYVGGVAVMAILSSQISKSPGPQRLVRGLCGLWSADSSNVAGHSAYQSKVTNDTLTSASYAKACYGGNFDPLRCSRYPVPNLAWDIDRNVTCPFVDTLCVLNDTAAATTLTSKPIDSHVHLGINAPSSARIQFQKKTTCAPIHSKGYAQIINVTSAEPALGYPGDTSIQWNYGSWYDSPDAIFQNYTYAYNTHAASDGFGYTVTVVAAQADYTAQGGWLPIQDLAQADADVTVVFIAPNSIYFDEPCDDPIFSAHTKFGDNSTGYAYNSDNYIGVLACTEQFRLCNSLNNVCTPYRGAYQTAKAIIANSDGLDLNVSQNTTAYRIMVPMQRTTVYQQVFTRSGGSLRAGETLTDRSQAPLPNNQWQIEIGAWFDAGLARLQAGVQELAANTDNLIAGSTFQAYDPSTPGPFGYFCRNQIINDSADSMSFSVLGLVILFVLGFAIILVSLSIDTIVGFIQQRTGKGLHARMEWLVNDRLQMHAMLLRQLGLGQWAGDVAKRIPVTVNGKQKFWGPGEVELRESGGSGSHLPADADPGTQLFQQSGTEDKEWEEAEIHGLSYQVAGKGT